MGRPKKFETLKPKSGSEKRKITGKRKADNDRQVGALDKLFKIASAGAGTEVSDRDHDQDRSSSTSTPVPVPNNVDLDQCHRHSSENLTSTTSDTNTQPDEGSNNGDVLHNPQTTEVQNQSDYDISNDENSEQPHSTPTSLPETDAQTLDLSVEYPTDRGYFTTLSTTLKRQIIEFGPCRPNIKFPENSKGRKFSNGYYVIHSNNGLKIPRTWICYSVLLDKVFCFCCWLVGDKESRSEWTHDGIDNWQSLSLKISKHEKSESHILAMVALKNWRENKTIDASLEDQMKSEAHFWRQVLRRIFKIILTISSGNTAFRGHRESLQATNPGNFFRLVLLVSEFDPILKSLVQDETHKIKYMSPLIQNEIISLMSTTLKRNICKEIREAPFFSLIVDSTPDINKVDQLSVILRYITIGTNQSVEVRESFLGFYHLEDQSASGYESLVLKILDENRIPLAKCRGQGYDGASTMSGYLTGLQARILARAENALYVHCSAHNINLVIGDGVKTLPRMSSFFETLQHIFTFFHSSAPRWSSLANIVRESEKEKPKSKSQSEKIKLKKLCDTRWEARHNAVFSLKFRFVEVLKCLSEIILVSKKSDEVNTAIGIKKKMENFEFIFLLVFWEKILRPLKLTSKKIQNVDIDIGECHKYWKRSLDELETLQGNFSDLYSEAVTLGQKWGITAEYRNKRKIFRKRFFDELSVDKRIDDKSPEEVFEQTIFTPVLAKVICQMKERFSGFQTVYDLFDFLTPKQLSSLSEDELTRATYDLSSKYSGDISSGLTCQVITFASCMRAEVLKMRSVKDVIDCIIKYDVLDSFPDLYIACALFLTIPVTIASAERSFSKLKLILNYLRNSMSQDRLSGLAILNIEASRVNELLDVENLITEFANVKSRRRIIK